MKPTDAMVVVPRWAVERAHAYVDEPCRRDHHGYCQTHDLGDGPCYVPALREALSAMPTVTVQCPTCDGWMVNNGRPCPDCTGGTRRAVLLPEDDR